MKTTVAPFSNIFNQERNQTGSIDILALDKQLPKKSSRNIYQQMSLLSKKAETLKNENEILQQELYDLVMNSDDPYCSMKKNLLEFSAKLTQREKEFQQISKYLIQPPKDNPTFLEVDLNLDKEASFDLVATSLLISNQQRSFFKVTDIQRQNDELLSFIQLQKEKLHSIESRLKLYSKCQLQRSARFKIESLRRGQNPNELADSSPDQITEQKMKIKMLSNVLRHLVSQRQRLKSISRRSTRLKTTPLGNRSEAAIIIQRAFRSYLARRKYAPKNENLQEEEK